MFSLLRSFVGRITNNQVYEDESEQLHQCFDRTTDSEVLATKLLLEKGADPLFLNRSGKSPLTVVAGARRNDIEAVKMMLEYVDQNVPIGTIKSHILAATAPYDDSHDTLWARKKPSLIIQKTLWNHHWRKVYPCPTESLSWVLRYVCSLLAGFVQAFFYFYQIKILNRPKNMNPKLTS